MNEKDSDQIEEPVMYISQMGGVIGAASKKRAKPLRQTGEIPALRRIVLTMQQAGVFPIVVVTGVDEDEVRWQLSKDHVIFLPVEDATEPSLFENAKIGLSYLAGKCETVLFTPVNAPLFTAQTILAMAEVSDEVVTPSYEGVSGHPVLIRDRIISEILNHNGEDGLRGAFRKIGDRRRRLPVDDAGILSLNQTDELLEEQVPIHNRSLLHPTVQISLGNESMFFNNRLKLLLFLIGDLKNVKMACEAMAISKGKAWNMINALEEELGFAVVARRQGGSQGGQTSLTDRGTDFLWRWQTYEAEVYRYAQEQYREDFSKILHDRDVKRE